MAHRRLRVPLGNRWVAVPVPPGWRAGLVEPPPTGALPDLNRAISEALERPIASPRLSELARGAVARAPSGKPPNATVVVTDATRDCPDDRFLPALLAELESGGIAPANVTILVATGLHRPSTLAEKEAMLGSSIAARVRVVDHDALDSDQIVDLGPIGEGIPATINRRVVEAELVVATGVVEPHQYAGYSGGAKTVAIGAAGEPTITATHGVAMLDQPGVRLARIAGNPFQAAVRELGARVGLAFVINLVADAEGRPIAVAAGSPSPTHDALVEIAQKIFTVPIGRQVDVAVAGVGAPKDVNLYQASRAVSYLHFAPVPLVRRGGVYVLPAEMPEGAGQGVGERRFYAALRGASGPADVIDRIRRSGGRAGEQRAYIVARVLGWAGIIVVGSRRPDVVVGAGLRAARTMDEAMGVAVRLAVESSPAGRSDPFELLVLPHATRTLPIVTESAQPPG